MANLRGLLTYCQRSFTQSMLKPPNNLLSQTQTRHITTTLAKPAASSKHSGTEQGVKRNGADHRRRLLAARFELRRKLYKAFCKDPELPVEMREKNRYKLSKLPRNSAFTRIRNRFDKNYICKVFQEATKAGATTLAFADTVGINMPQEYGELVRYVKPKTPGCKGFNCYPRTELEMT
ncbi:Ribosomal protein S14 protein [Raphanus sativus]|nr:Ribosomal protein S14 protein [Raphanus sativus]